MKVEQIVSLLKEDFIIAIPTDTVYGLVSKASPLNWKKINKLKSSPLTKKISLISNNIDNYSSLVKLTPFQRDFINQKIPGRFTFIVDIENKLNAKKILGWNDNVGIRIPANDDLNSNFLNQILEHFDFLFATSLNISGKEPIKTYNEAVSIFGDKIKIVDLKNKLLSKPSKIYQISSNDIVKIIRE